MFPFYSRKPPPFVEKNLWGEVAPAKREAKWDADQASASRTRSGRRIGVRPMRRTDNS